MFANAQGLGSHAATHRVDAREESGLQALPCLVLSQLAWLQSHPRDAIDEANDAARQHAHVEGGESPLKAQRGQDRRKRRDVKFKVRWLRLYDALREELEHKAEQEGTRTPSIQDVFVVLEANGFPEPRANMYSWLRNRATLEKDYHDSQKRKMKTSGSGRKSLIPLTEAAVAEMIKEMRSQSLRVPRSLVLRLLKDKSHELEPLAAEKLKFSRSYLHAAYRRMHVVVRRISSTKPTRNEDAAKLGRFMCYQLMELRDTGACSFFPDQSWANPSLKHSVFGFFPPECIFTADEVPFNFAEEGHSVAFSGQDAAVRTLTGTGKRFGTCVVIANAAGELLPFVIIFKAGKRGFKTAEEEEFKKHKNVTVTFSKSSYITEDIWIKKVIEGVVLRFIMKRYGVDFHKRRYLFLSDNHGSHHTDGVLETCHRNSILPAFTPPNYTSHWSHIDDYVGTGARSVVYRKAQEYEVQTFHENPEHDGSLAIGKRRLLSVTWWSEAFQELQTDRHVELRKNAAKRVGLWVTALKPADTSYLPAPVRFKGTPYELFGEALYEKDHPDALKVTPYNFSYEKAQEIHEELAHDEDFHSGEEECVWRSDEEGQKSESENFSDDDVDTLHQVIAARRARRKEQGIPKIVDQFDALDAAEGRRRRSSVLNE